MPHVEVRFFEDDRGRAPVRDWLGELQTSQPVAFAKCQARIARLEASGFELRRPHADYLQEGILELRVRTGRVQRRILYFFHGRSAVILTHALCKEDRIPEMDLARALARKQAYESNPERHTHATRWSHA